MNTDQTTLRSKCNHLKPETDLADSPEDFIDDFIDGFNDEEFLKYIEMKAPYLFENEAD